MVDLLMVNVSKYTSPMDRMGIKYVCSPQKFKGWSLALSTPIFQALEIVPDKLP